MVSAGERCTAPVSAPPGSSSTRVVATVYGPPPGQGGSGVLADQVLSGLAAAGGTVHALGPRSPVASPAARSVVWYDPPETVASWRLRYSWLRWNTGRLVLLRSRARGRWAARKLERISPALCYAFAEVGLEPLQWARARGIASVLDSPSGNIRHFHNVVTREYERWCHAPARSHPIPAMVDRVEEEYRLADRIRAASMFTRDSMIQNGVAPDKISVVPYPMDLSRFHPPEGGRRPGTGPLRVCYVGMLAMHKGFVYLLRAARSLGPSAVSLRLIGGTVDRHTRRLLRDERRGLSVIDGPARDVIEELHRAELLVLPSLHDGFGFVVAEAMATGLPVIVTDQTGAADWVVDGETGWVIRAADPDVLAGALQSAIDRRASLPEMGHAARGAVANASGSEEEFRRWAYAGGTAGQPV
jgi:glycosyltransferase involved in cell wall biosynthesis